MQFLKFQPAALLRLATLALCVGASGAGAMPPPPQPEPPAASASAPTPASGCIDIEVLHVRPRQGVLMVAAYTSADSFRKQPKAALRLPAGEATMRFALSGLGDAAEVALTLYQDLDGDGRMATNLLGMPTEPWGASGSPGLFGPDWDSGRVKRDGRVIGVRMSQ